MKQNLKNSIEKWKKNGVGKEFRSVKSDPSKVVPGEYSITIKMASRVKYLSASEEVILTREIGTVQQALSDDEIDNPNGDIDGFERAAKQLEKDFQIKFEETYSRLWKSQTPEGFV